MTKLSGLFPEAAGKPKGRQFFTANGTFTPSAEVLAAGGWVYVRLKGGGGAGAVGAYNNNGEGGGSGGGSGFEWHGWVQVSGPVAVTIGLGGVGGNSPQAGSPTLFGGHIGVRGGEPGVVNGLSLASGAFEGGRGAVDGGIAAKASVGLGGHGWGLAVNIANKVFGYGAGGIGGPANTGSDVDRQGTPGLSGCLEILWFD